MPLSSLISEHAHCPISLFLHLSCFLDFLFLFLLVYDNGCIETNRLFLLNTDFFPRARISDNRPFLPSFHSFFLFFMRTFVRIFIYYTSFFLHCQAVEPSSFVKIFCPPTGKANRRRGVVKALKNFLSSLLSILLFLSLSLRFSLTTPLPPILGIPSEDKKMQKEDFTRMDMFCFLYLFYPWRTRC